MSERGSKPAFATVLDERRQNLRAELQRILVSQSAFLWEVGCGHGHFLTEYAAVHPQTVCIGVDLASDRIGRAVRKRDRSKLDNLHFIRAEARLFLEAIPAAVRISNLFVLFPDPWPKLRHHKHRVLQPEFLAAVAERAQPGCRLHFRTDYQPYFAEVRSSIANSVAWELDAGPWPFEFVTVFQSRAEHHHSLIARLRNPAT